MHVRRPRWRRAAGIAAAIAVSATAVPAAQAAAGSAPPTAPVRIGAAPRLPARTVPAATPADSQPLHLRIGLAPRDPAGLAAFVAAVSDPKSRQYRHYLAPGEFGSRFGATPAALAAVGAELRSIGLSPGATDGSGESIAVDTTVGAAKSILHTGFSGYTTADGRHAFANTAAPALPPALASAITGITGLDDLTAPRPQFVSSNLGSQAALTPQAPSPDFAAPGLCPQETSILAGQGKTDGQQYYDPADLNAIYGNRDQYIVGDYGEGVTVALPEFEGFTPAAIAQYQNCVTPQNTNAGTPGGLTTIAVDGGPTTAAPTAANQVGMETALDVETINGTAPGAAVRDYEGPDTAVGALDTYQRIVTDDQAQVIAISWSVCELDAAPATLAAENTIFQQAAAQGQSVLAATGDNGSTACPASSPHAATPAVSDPASQPSVTAVGGTTMSGGGGAGLTTWNTSGGATGGGVSTVWKQDAIGAAYQAGHTGPGYADACGAPAGTTCRQVPDVAAHAGADGLIVEYYATGTAGSWAIVGGTSLATQLWAGITALADSSDDCAATGPIGPLNPALYHAAADGSGSFTDVTTGSNARPASGYTGALYTAGPGYDLTTGLGAPLTDGLVPDLCGYPAPAAGSTYHPVSPARILDTRNGTGAGGRIAQVPAGGTVTLAVTGAHGVPASGVTGTALNLTAVSSLGGYLSVSAHGTARPLSSTVNYGANRPASNFVTVAVPAGGQIDITNHGTAGADVIADLSGYYSATLAGGSTYTAVNPFRILDTRVPNGVPAKAPVAAHGTLALQISGTHGIPATGVTAVALNIQVADDASGGDLIAYADGTTQPLASNDNWAAGQTVSDFALVPVGADGKIDLYNSSPGSANVIADFAGYSTTAATGLKFHPIRAARLLDTRDGTGVNSTAGQPYQIPAGGSFTVNLDPVALLLGGNPHNAVATAPAVALNLTVASPSSGGYITVYPDGQSLPAVVPAAVDFTAGQTTADAAILPVGADGGLTVTNHSGGTIQLVIDLIGYYGTT
ncbi:Peptidase S53 propeptide [Catenulispora acidiphila DSM 44928]|uniref:Peptidase S53 propeptide n=1 Tax=Catenulispora acidiphila (strain DSM 44928 / JCM 14897 / NBRC 102108 / NRRL B-24433 / ID139908) TaxID=479433 RepID=C7PWI3_CATAD|nr:S53 family peptidase [Catenulispora acidiphila]ACU75263.1 Peptidase S53 propeptide [Catenulispora acidiphila DSM 44928]